MLEFIWLGDASAKICVNLYGLVIAKAKLYVIFYGLVIPGPGNIRKFIWFGDDRANRHVN